MLAVSTLRGREQGQRLIVPAGLIDDFDRDDGWVGDRPASCGNWWEGQDPTVPGYLSGGALTNTPGVTWNGGGLLHLGGVSTSGVSIIADITGAQSSSSRGDQSYWVVQLLADAPDDPRGRNVQFEVSQRNSYVVWYYPGASFPTIYAGAGAGYAYNTTKRWYFTAKPGATHATFLLQTSNLDGSGLTTVLSGNTGSDTPDGQFMALAGADDNKFLTCSRVATALPPVLLQQAYSNNGVSSTTHTVTLGSAVASGDTAVAVIYEYPATASVTSISGLGATWTQAVRVSNGGNMAMSVWVGAGCSSGSSITTTSSAGQTNEVNLSTWSNLTGTIGATASSQNTVQTTLLTGSVTPGAVSRLVIGGVITNTTPTMTWTDSPAAWTALTGSTDMFPAYRVATAVASHSRSGSASVAANYCGTAVEVA